MNPAFVELLADLPMFALVLARVGAAMALLPGVGETLAPASVRIGLALSITILLTPLLPPVPSLMQGGSLDLPLMAASEVVTGLWFGWVVRMIVLALPAAAQFISYLVGLSSVLQPDAQLASQTTALGRLFEMATPALVLLTGLYSIPLRALSGLFELIPVGHLLPADDSTGIAVNAVVTAFNLALQLASPFLVVGVIWHLAMGQVARSAARMQIYFVSMPGQILLGLALLMVTTSAIIMAWHDGVQTFMNALPGSG